MKSDLKKLIFKIFVVSFPLWALVIYISVCPYGFMTGDNIGVKWGRDYIRQSKSQSPRVIILGDSTANAAYLPEMLSNDTVNLAEPGTGVVENYYTLYEYVEKNTPPEDVFISIMDYHLNNHEMNIDTANMVHKYSFFENKEIYDNFSNTDGTSVQLISDDFWRDYFSYVIHSPRQYVTSLINAKICTRYSENIKLYHDTTLRLGRYSSISNEEYEPEREEYYKDFPVMPIQDLYYNKLISLCEENGIRLHIVKLPIASNAIFEESFGNCLYNYYDNLISGHDNTDFYWFDETYDANYFCDDYHPNNHGSLKFTSELKQVYPMVFPEYNADSVSNIAIDEDIKGENYFSELLKWIADKDYSLILSGDKASIEGCFADKDDKIQLIEYSFDQKKDNMYTIYYMVPSGKNLPEELSIEANRQNFSLMSDGKQIENINELTDNDISVIVYDNLNKQVVRKLKLSSEDGYTEIQ